MASAKATASRVRKRVRGPEAASAGASTLDTLGLSLRRELLLRRRCKGCRREWPGYVKQCRLCLASLGDLYEFEIVLVVPQFARGEVPARALPVAALALELSGSPLEGDALPTEAMETIARFVAALPGEAVLRGLPNGVLVALVAAGSLLEAAAAAARAAASLRGRGRLERRAGMAIGLVDGADPFRGAVVALAARLARAAQSGQTLAGYGVARLLDLEWQFGPVGVLPRREEDAVERAFTFFGRKAPAPTPSALAPDQGPGLVGRSAELAILDAELEGVQAGGGQWCAVVAPAGCGKSKLLRTWLSRLDRDTVRVAGVAATAFGQAPRALTDQLVHALEVSARAHVANVEASSALADALQRLARERPLVVLIDDLHWADAESLAVLRALDDRPPPRCLIVAALRSSFVSDVPWLFERARRLELPSLCRSEREELLSRLLSGEAAAPLRARLLDVDHSSDPLYLEQAAAYLQEAEPEAPVPRTLHEAVLRRLELARARIDRRGHDRPSEAELITLERTVGEWLDRLESDDYESREQIAEYLNLLEQIDSALVVAGSLANVPVKRNRRLAAAIERFYTATFAERIEVIEGLAEREPANAVYAAARGAERSLAALRIDDAGRYLALAARLTRGDVRAGHLLTLGDVLLARGLTTRAWHAYAEARQAGEDNDVRARCDWRLGHVALVREHARLAERLLGRALPRLPREERLSASCDLAVARALTGGKPAATSALCMLDEATEGAESPLLLRTRLRLTLLGAPGDRARLAHECAAAFAFDDELVADLGALVETTLLLLQAHPASVGSELLKEAAEAAQLLSLGRSNRR